VQVFRKLIVKPVNSQNMNCKDYKKHFLSFLDGELHQELANDINKHIENCNSCATEIEQMKAVINIIQEEKSEFKQNPYLAAKISAKIQNKVVHAPRGRFSIQYITVASLAAAGFSIGILIGSLNYSSSSTVQDNNETVQVWNQLADDYMPEVDNNPYSIVINSNETQEKP